MKTKLSDLAYFGGTPAFAEPLHVGRPNIGNRERLMERINEMLDRRWFTNNGPYVQELEQRIADYLGVKHCIAMVNGTVALEIATRSVELTGEVIMPSFTFIATAHALQWQEITPVFCDVAPGTHHMDPEKVEALITPRTTAIVGVHVWGETYSVERLQEIADKHGLYLMFDAAHAFGASHNGQMIGNFGAAEIFSFHATKFFNTLEGGAVTTNDDALAEKVRYMRNFGFAGYDRVDYIGINGKMNEASAAMGLTSFESLDHFITTNRRNYEAYCEGLKDIPGVTLYSYKENEQRNYQYIIVDIDESETGISRDLVVKILQAENVLARRYFYPGCHEMEPYRSYFPHAGLLLPETEKLTQKVMSLPTGTAVDVEDVEKICGIIRYCISHAPEVISKLAVVAADE